MPSTSGSQKQDKQEEAKVSAAVYTHGNDSLKIPLSGLLADRPELKDEDLTPTEWDVALEEYLQSPRP